MGISALTDSFISRLRASSIERLIIRIAYSGPQGRKGGQCPPYECWFVMREDYGWAKCLYMRHAVIPQLLAGIHLDVLQPREKVGCPSPRGQAFRENRLQSCGQAQASEMDFYSLRFTPHEYKWHQTVWLSSGLPI